jgi:TRAP transporter TAXI family solute receptor
MDKNIRRFRQGLLDVISTWGIALVVIVVGFVVTYQFVEPAPPTRIVLATGQDGGAYHYYGEQFAAYLAGQGIETELLETAGAVENLERLESGAGVNLAFVQGGLADIATVENVVAIGSLYWEPLWLFARADVEISAVDDLVGKRVAIGREGSGTRAVTLNLLQAHGIDAQNTEFLDVSSDVLVAKFAQQSVDAAFLIGAPASGDIAELIRRPDVKLLSLQRASAYVRRYPYFSRISLPQGAIDLQFNVPATDIDTVALTAMLVAHRDLHPALIDLLLIAAADIFGDHGLLVDAGQFPTPRYVDLPLSEDAERFFEHGPPFLMQYLPFWAATLVDRLWIMLLPLIGLAIPLIKLLPPAYRWRIRRRLLLLYAELENIDPLVNPVHGEEDRADRMQRLDRLDTGSVIGAVPKTYTDDVYKLRRDIDLVRRRIDAG